MAQKNKKLAKVFHFDLYGKRQEKYDFLNNNSINSINWNKLENRKPEFFFVKKDWETDNEFSMGFKIDELFHFGASGMVGGRDSIVINMNENFERLLSDFRNETDFDTIRTKYKLKDSRDWVLKDAIDDVKLNDSSFAVPKVQ